MPGKKEFTDYVTERVNPIIESMGYKVVEARIGVSRKQQHLSIVIYKPTGVTLNDCSRVARKIQPELEREEFADLTIEISSPGIDRTFKSLDELAIFQGRGVRVWLKDARDWVGGVIGDITTTDFVLTKDEKMINISKNSVQKIKLDDTEEASKTKCQ
jgi:ribosome maturation factor RimP